MWKPLENSTMQQATSQKHPVEEGARSSVVQELHQDTPGLLHVEAPSCNKLEPFLQELGPLPDGLSETETVHPQGALLTPVTILPITLRDNEANLLLGSIQDATF